ncbi:HDOD domain-containing protein [Sulfurimonas sp.]|uniref:HDOD domain-containing protein n=1 Tax=Sulfurimonas sp. TaxID=2022749 RepID=UPI0035629D8D
MTFENIVENIDTLPPLSNAANVVRSMYSSGLEMMSVSSLVRVLESDAMLMANMLKMINTPFYGFRKKILTARQAVTLLGTYRVYMFIVKYSIDETLKADTSIYGFNTQQFNELCHLQSALLYQWYSQVNKEDAKYLSQLALVMESGKLLVANEVTKSDYVGEFRKEFNECENLIEFEKEMLGMSSYRISAELFKHWNLDDHFIEVLKALDYTKEEFKELDVYIKRHRHIIHIITTVINVKEILTDHSIALASKKVGKLGLSRNMFERSAYKVRDAYFN